jgi:hypothetical protein
MAFRSKDFADDTEFERLVLERLGTYRVKVADADMVYHLGEDGPGTRAIHVSLETVIGGAGLVEELRRDLHPLGFGAAYKVLDQLVEHVLRDNGASSGRLTFAAKLKAVTKRPAKLPKPLDSRPDIWDRLAALYVAFVDARHAVTHRRASADANGDLQVFDDSGRQTDTVTDEEIRNFAGAIHSIAELVIEQSDDERRFGIASWHLNGVRARHGSPMLIAPDPNAGRGVLRAKLRVRGEDLNFDLAGARKAIENQQRGFWDLELLAPTGNIVYAARWEDVPDPGADELSFNPSSPPHWLTPELSEGRALET